MKHKHATLLTAIGQGIPVEYQDAGGWHVADSEDLEEFNPLSNPDWNWRVKPAESVYEWQWAYYTREFLTWIVTDCHMTKSSAEDFFRGRHIHERIEGSKREVEL